MAHSAQCHAGGGFDLLARDHRAHPDTIETMHKQVGGTME
jgi:hypothetical protein